MKMLNLTNILNLITGRATLYPRLSDWARKYPDLIKIGEGTYGNRIYCEIYNQDTKLIIGKYCSVATDVSFLLGGNHRKDWGTTYPFPALWKEAYHISGHPMSKGDIIVGNDVWIGHRSIILSGSRLHDGVIVGAGSVVASQEFPPYSIISGNPARVTGYRFAQPIIDGLLQLRWWDWPENKIIKHLDLMCSENVAELLKLG